MVSLVEKFFQNAERHPDKLAVIFENEEVTYGELRESVIRLTSWFKLQGVEVGDRIVVQAAYCKWYVAACYAAHLCGAIFVPVEKTLTEETIRSAIKQMDAKIVISMFELLNVISLKYQDMDKILSDVEEQPWEFPRENWVTNIMMTSGTTGPQKGAMLTHENMVVNSRNRIREMGISKNDIGITTMPLNHVGSMRMWQAALYNGSTYILQDGMWNLRAFYGFMEKYPVSSMYISPSGIAVIEQLSQNKLHEYAGQIDYVHVGASLLQKPQRDFLKKMLPHSRLYNVFGSTETGTVVLYRFDLYDKDIYCVGKPFSGVEVRILDDNLQEVSCGDQGRVAFRSAMNCKGYWKMPELTEEVYYDGFFLTNDAGYLDGKGFLYVPGRLDDVINIGGLKVHPSEIEKAALEIDGVGECICFNVPSQLTGSAAKLLIRQKDGVELDIREIRNKLANKLDSYKIPTYIEFVSEIEKTPNGKPDRKYYRNTTNSGQ